MSIDENDMMDNELLNKRLKDLSDKVFQTGDPKEIETTNKVLLWALISTLAANNLINMRDFTDNIESAAMLYENLKRRFEQEKE